MVRLRLLNATDTLSQRRISSSQQTVGEGFNLHATRKCVLRNRQWPSSTTATFCDWSLDQGIRHLLRPTEHRIVTPAREADLTLITLSLLRKCTIVVCGASQSASKIGMRRKLSLLDGITPLKLFSTNECAPKPLQT